MLILYSCEFSFPPVLFCFSFIRISLNVQKNWAQGLTTIQEPRSSIENKSRMPSKYCSLTLFASHLPESLAPAWTYHFLDLRRPTNLISNLERIQLSFWALISLPQVVTETGDWYPMLTLRLPDHSVHWQYLCRRFRFCIFSPNLAFPTCHATLLQSLSKPCYNSWWWCSLLKSIGRSSGSWCPHWHRGFGGGPVCLDG